MGLLGAALAGFGGGAKGYEAAMVRHDETNAKAQQHQWDLDKEKRIEEATIRAEGRSSTNAAKERQAALDFSIDPNNVKRATDAKLEEKAALDKYANDNFETTLNQKTQEYNATHPYEKEKTLAEIESQKAHAEYYRSAGSTKADGISKQDELIIKSYENKKTELDKIKKEGVEAETWTAKKEIDNKAKFDWLTQQQEVVLQRNGVQFPSATDPASGSGKPGDSFGLNTAGKAVASPAQETKPVPTEGIISKLNKAISTPSAEQQAKDRAGRGEDIGKFVDSVTGKLTPSQQKWYDALSARDKKAFDWTPRRDKIAILRDK